jgi:hypothetical protein
MLNFVDCLQLPAHSEPVTCFSQAPFLGCTFNQCQCAQKELVDSKMHIKVEGLVFREGILQLMRTVPAGTYFRFKTEQMSELLGPTVKQVRKTAPDEFKVV